MSGTEDEHVAGGERREGLGDGGVSEVDCADGTAVPPGGDSDDDLGARVWLDRCRGLAEADLDGIEDAALELAALAEGDRRLMERARRLLLEELEQRPQDRTLVQMQWLWRRAFEKGSWEWDDGSVGEQRIRIGW